MRLETKEYMSGSLGSAARNAPRSKAAKPSGAQVAARPAAAEGTRTLDLGAVLDAVLQMAGGSARRRGVHVASRVHGAPSVTADPVLLFGAVEGLVANAIARSGNGEIVICAVRVLDREVVISVADTGADLHGTDLARMLWPHATDALQKPGLLDGAWLARTRHLVGARLEARSRGPGAGIVVSLHMPLAA